MIIEVNVVGNVLIIKTIQTTVAQSQSFISFFHLKAYSSVLLDMLCHKLVSYCYNEVSSPIITLVDTAMVKIFCTINQNLNLRSIMHFTSTLACLSHDMLLVLSNL